MKRSGKFYYKNEKETMQRLGMEQVPGSGNGWIHKEDGEDDNVICQLKSTDANSIKINKLDLEKLEYNAAVSHKIPLFTVQFLKDDSLYLLVKPEDLKELAECLGGEVKRPLRERVIDYDMDITKVKEKPSKVIVKSSGAIREELEKERKEKYKKEKKAK